MLTEKDLIRRIEGFTVEELHYCVGRGWVAPSGTAGQGIYMEIDVARLRLIRELRFELGVDEDAIPILLSLLDQLHTVRQEMRSLTRAIQEQPRAVQSEIAAAVRRLKREG